jgi:hypothetical protein
MANESKPLPLNERELAVQQLWKRLIATVGDYAGVVAGAQWVWLHEYSTREIHEVEFEVRVGRQLFIVSTLRRGNKILQTTHVRMPRR